MQVFLDEMDEELDGLVDVLLKLEDDPAHADSLDEAFRLLHSLKGSSGMMGFEGIGELAHKLESRFENFRSGEQQFDRNAMNVVLKCIDFLREFSSKHRIGEEPNQDEKKLIQQIENLDQAPSGIENEVSDKTDLLTTGKIFADTLKDLVKDKIPEGSLQVRVTFESGLHLADLKARLIVKRLSDIGEIISSDPPVDDIQSFEDLPQFVVTIQTDHEQNIVHNIANVVGVESVEIVGQSKNTIVENDVVPRLQSLDAPLPNQPLEEGRSGETESKTEKAVPESNDSEDSNSESADTAAKPVQKTSQTKISETVRVDLERLDQLMNLTGELIITKARFTQIAAQMSPILRNSRVATQAKDHSERLRLCLENIRTIASEQAEENNNWNPILRELEDELDNLEDQSALWEEGRKHFTQIAEAIDQLSRVSDNLQQGVLGTRMVLVGPMFNRFKRVIRDLSIDRGKKIQLIIHGDKTEIDKRMIDELGDPLLHLIRNSLDHGLESPEDRIQLGKPATGTISLDATHSGNNVFITVRDDGAGLNAERIKARIIERGLATESGVNEMTDQQIIEHIWHPGFSTAEKVTDISGRGVGLDIVKQRIMELNGSIEIDSEPGKGASFKIRLPLTLAVIRSLLIRFCNGLFSIPIDDVREIVSVSKEQIHSLQNNQTIDVRGEFIPLVSMTDVFTWQDLNLDNHCNQDIQLDESSSSNINVVILHSLGKTLGLAVDELLGGADIVIKSLSDNFINIRGLSGVSVMGDGTVSLMLDVKSIIEITMNRSQ
ncbi:MAG: chemotaxis protein CheW [Pirellulales bacterium]